MSSQPDLQAIKIDHGYPLASKEFTNLNGIRKFIPMDLKGSVHVSFDTHHAFEYPDQTNGIL